MTREPHPPCEPERDGPLAGLRVIELADEKGQFCGKLLADLGADVIKVEPPGGHETRDVGPFLDGVRDRERSLYFWHYNTSKRGITLRVESPEGADVFRRLTRTADVVLETHPPGYLPGLGLGYEELAKSNLGLVMCSLTPFGQTGPWRDYKTSDLLHLAAGGQMASCGYDAEDVPHAPPIAPGGGNAWHMGSHFAYIAIMAALHQRYVTGEGQYIDTSIHEACALTTEGAVPIYEYTGRVVARHTGRAASADSSLPAQLQAKDGDWMTVTGTAGMNTPGRLRVLAEWMDSHGLARDLLEHKYEDPTTFEESTAHVREVLSDFVASLSQDEAWHGGQERGFPWGAIRTIDEIVEDEHLRDRDFFVEADHPDLGRSFTYPGATAIYGDSPWRISRRAPLIGEHNEEVLCGELGLSGDELAALAESGVI